jgi:CubicO group peptidase (beta-lactamase class C family)
MIEPRLPSKAVKAIIEGRIRDHVFFPPNLLGVTSDRRKGEPQSPGELREISKKVASRKGLILNVSGFKSQLEDQLREHVGGYVFALQRRDEVVCTGQNRYAMEPIDGEVEWSLSRRIHVASVSKLITAIALTRLLKARSLAPDTPIVEYLPEYWSKGPNIEKVTFSHLMTHKSGFQFYPENDRCDFLFMKDNVALGIDKQKIGTYKYENINFGLCRILISVVAKQIVADLKFSDLSRVNDRFWDVATFSIYEAHVQAEVFEPSNIEWAAIDHAPGDALAYDLPATNPGWNSGNLQQVSGAAGWHLSVNDLLRLMASLRRGGKILSSGGAQKMLDDKFGIDYKLLTDAGLLYAKDGLWRNDEGQMEQCLVCFLPKDMEVALLVNSPIRGDAELELIHMVARAYAANLN